ncbi:MAG TPA: PEGA domain-containing protein [Polyangiales bacterium]|nr:PEGA domain-containing protein [Polyangiales bacterium]
MRFIAGLVLSALCLGGAATRVHAADASVVVLGLRSLEGDDDFANGMTDALRSGAKGISGWHVIDRSVSMSQMALAHNCDDIDAPCLNEIAKGLEVDRVVFGTSRRTAARGKFDYEITVSIFNAATHTIVGTETETVPKSEGKQKKALAQHAQMLIGRLAAADANAGRLSIEVNVNTAAVLLDDKPAGDAQDGKLVIENVSPGEHSLEVSAAGHQVVKQRISVSASDQTTVSVNLEPTPEEPTMAAAPEALGPTEPADEGHGSLSWLGYTLIGVGAASAIAWGASMYTIQFGYNHNSTYERYRDSYGSRISDACDAAAGGNMGGLTRSQWSDFKGQCSTAHTFQVLQWVFLGVAVVSAGAGTLVLVNESGTPDRAPQTARIESHKLSIDPMFDKRTLALQATLKF